MKAGCTVCILLELKNPKGQFLILSKSFVEDVKVHNLQFYTGGGLRLRLTDDLIFSGSKIAH